MMHGQKNIKLKNKNSLTRGNFWKLSNLSITLLHEVVAGLEGNDIKDIKGIPIIYLTVPSQHLSGGNVGNY